MDIVLSTSELAVVASLLAQDNVNTEVRICGLPEDVAVKVMAHLHAAKEPTRELVDEFETFALTSL
jgi:hypothetical protein